MSIIDTVFHLEKKKKDDNNDKEDHEDGTGKSQDQI